MSRRFHVFIILGMMLWVVAGIMFPKWEGRYYNPESIRNPGHWFPGGSFGLQEDKRFCPIWSPPRAYSPDIAATVRWPWQAPSQHNHVEVSVVALAAWIAFGLIFSGIVCRIAAAISPPPKPDALLTLSWTLAMGLVLGFVVSMVLAFFSMGMAPDSLYLTLLLLGAIAGVVTGIIFVQRGKRHLAVTVGISSADDPAPNRDIWPPPGSSDTVGSRPMGAGMFWFTLGIISSLVLLFTGLSIAGLFRGPIQGSSPLFTPEYVRDQGPLNMTTGAGIAIAGWAIGMWLFRARGLRPLGAGLISGATLFGVLVASWR